MLDAHQNMHFNIQYAYMTTIIQFYMVNIRQICCKTILIKLHTVLTFYINFSDSRLETHHFLQLLFIKYIC